ncbi:hypothetical protein Zmor_010804 [Zophobas morio]|uniref:Uncharacterized protein n=1 Tax=Zophobas morio TaxID=2755281 RepID=A0AA38IS40_9CUCU|nr:hypothetical protein Zmor_010804 [Zophobas morio]
MARVLLFLVLIICLNQTHSTPDYYWREYTGQIPEDAVEGGKDLRGNPTYIGQAFVLHHGILIGTIYPGQKTLTTSKEGIHVTSVGNKILCSHHKHNFEWVPGQASTLHITTINKHLVPGGIEWGKVLNIGRIKYQGELIVGKVCSGTIGRAKLYFPYKNEEIDVSSYEILTYKENDSNVPVV